jgi:hypothetical protein
MPYVDAEPSYIRTYAKNRKGASPLSMSGTARFPYGSGIPVRKPELHGELVPCKKP